MRGGTSHGRHERVGGEKAWAGRPRGETCSRLKKRVRPSFLVSCYSLSFIFIPTFPPISSFVTSARLLFFSLRHSSLYICTFVFFFPIVLTALSLLSLILFCCFVFTFFRVCILYLLCTFGHDTPWLVRRYSARAYGCSQSVFLLYFVFHHRETSCE